MVVLDRDLQRIVREEADPRARYPRFSTMVERVIHWEDLTLELHLPNF